MSNRDLNRERFLKYRPKLYHVSLADNLEQIEQHGLLSTTALLDLHEVPDQRRKLLQFSPRAEREELQHAVHGRMFLNNQKPLLAGPLVNCLVGMTSDDWCNTLNSRVFFWTTEQRVRTLFESASMSIYQKIVLEADARTFLQEYEGEVEVARFNTGNTRRKPLPRGSGTFRPLVELLECDTFSVSDIVEFTVPYAVNKMNLFKLYTPTSGA